MLRHTIELSEHKQTLVFNVEHFSVAEFVVLFVVPIFYALRSRDTLKSGLSLRYLNWWNAEKMLVCYLLGILVNYAAY